MDERDKITEMVNLVTHAHRGQFRNYGDMPYVSHLFDVLNRLHKWGATKHSTNIILGALGHDLYEQTQIGHREISVKLNKELADLILELTFNGSTPEEKQLYMESFENSSVEALVIKCADRICNILNFAMYDEEYALEYAKKGHPVFYSISNRSDEIIKTFGTYTLVNIRGDIIFTLGPDNAKKILY